MHKQRTQARHVSRRRCGRRCVLQQRCTRTDPQLANIHSQSGQGDAFFQLSLVSGPGDRIAN